MSLRVIVTGSRNFADRELIHDKLAVLATMRGPVTVVHGGCPTGADAHASAWVAEWTDEGHVAKEIVYPADWDSFGKAAGPIRSRQMVRDGADLVLAFLSPGGRNAGTTNCVLAAAEAAIPFKVYTETAK